MTKMPPGNSLLRTVLPLSRDLDGLTNLLRTEQSSISGPMRCFELRFAISVVGWTHIIGPGAMWMLNPTQLLPLSVFPNCAPAINTTVSVRVCGERASMISRRYGVRLVRHFPGSGELRGVSQRFASAHCEIVRSGSGRRPLANAPRYVFSGARGCYGVITIPQILGIFPGIFCGGFCYSYDQTLAKCLV